MNKILLIINREYLSRVRKKSFIIMTLLSPLLFAGVISLVTFLNTQENTDDKVIAIEDYSNLYSTTFKSTEHIKYEYINSGDSLKNKNYLAKALMLWLLLVMTFYKTNQLFSYILNLK